MVDVWETITLKFSLTILEQLQHAERGLRNKSIEGIDNDWTKTITLKRLVSAGLVSHVHNPDNTAFYRITLKGRKALEFALKIKNLDDD